MWPPASGKRPSSSACWTTLLSSWKAKPLACCHGELGSAVARLADALRSGHLGGAATDVLSVEPPVNGNPLLAGDIPRLIVTPHNAWGSREARQRIVGQLAENAQGFFSGAPLRVVS